MQFNETTFRVSVNCFTSKSGNVWNLSRKGRNYSLLGILQAYCSLVKRSTAVEEVWQLEECDSNSVELSSSRWQLSIELWLTESLVHKLQTNKPRQRSLDSIAALSYVISTPAHANTDLKAFSRPMFALTYYWTTNLVWKCKSAGRNPALAVPESPLAEPAIRVKSWLSLGWGKKLSPAVRYACGPRLLSGCHAAPKAGGDTSQSRLFSLATMTWERWAPKRLRKSTVTGG